jgi:hypothetical protein
MALGKSILLGSMAAILGAGAFAAQAPLAMLPPAPVVVAPSGVRKKRRPEPKRTPVRWRGKGLAKSYMSRRSLPAGRTSTLKKTARLLRLQAGDH